MESAPSARSLAPAPADAREEPDDDEVTASESYSDCEEDDSDEAPSPPAKRSGKPVAGTFGARRLTISLRNGVLPPPRPQGAPKRESWFVRWFGCGSRPNEVAA